MVRNGKKQMYISLNKIDTDILEQLMDKIGDSASNVIAKALQYYADKLGVNYDTIPRD